MAVRFATASSVKLWPQQLEPDVAWLTAEVTRPRSSYTKFWLRPEHTLLVTEVISPLLPAYPEHRSRDRLFLVIGEVHHAKKPEPVEQPRWLVIPDRGLFTGI